MRSTRGFTVLLLAALLAGKLSAGKLSAGERPAGNRPSFLLILVDDLGARDLSVDGSTFHETPRLDAFAATALRFTQGYASHPVCSPTRAALLTGKNPARVRITDWIPGANPRDRRLLGPDDRDSLALEETTLAERLREAGYATFFAGKWHLGGAGHLPTAQGFEINRGGHHAGSPPGGYYAPYRNPELEDGPEGEYLPDRLAAETSAFLEASRERPFFAMLAFYTVHTPIEAARRHIEHFESKRREIRALEERATIAEGAAETNTRQDQAAYASMVRAMDENVGRILDRLSSLGLADTTIVAFTSDNGGLSTLRARGGSRRRAPTSNAPLRAGKGWCYEGGIRVPWIIRVPGLTRPGSSCAEPIWSADLYPTVLSLAGLESRPGEHPDGVDLSPLLRGEAKLPRGEAGRGGDRELVWHFPHYHGSGWTPGSAIRSGEWKLIEFYEESKIELFDLARDPFETKDFAEEEPERSAALRTRLHAYLESVDAQMPRANSDSGR